VTVIDIHPHIVSHDNDRYPIAPIGGKRSDWSHERSVELEEMIAGMDEAGIDYAAVVHSSTTYGFACDYLADSVAKHPDRLTGVFSVNVLEPDATEAMQHWYDRGLTGMRIFSRGSTMEGPWLAIDDPTIFPCYELAAEKNISVATNVTVDLFAQLESVLKQFPQVNFVVDHLGKTDFTDGAPFNNAEPLFDLAEYPNLYLKVTSKNVKEANDGKCTPEALFAKLVSVFCADHLAWGSNYPSAKGNLKDLLGHARKGFATLSSTDRDWILGDTALVLYPELARLAKAAA
jgi:L-fuconolactonase